MSKRLSLAMALIVGVFLGGMTVGTVLEGFPTDLLVTLVLSTKTQTEMLPLGLTKFVLEYGVDWGSMTAAGMIMFIPTLLFVFIAQRYLIQGLTMGGVKD